MLSYYAVAYLDALTYRDDAERVFCLLPIGGIYWEDEIPDPAQFASLSEDDQCQIWRLFAIRIAIWEGAALSEADQEFWDRARRQAPDCPLFRRLDLSSDDRREQDAVKRATASLLNGFMANASHILRSEIQPCIWRISAVAKKA